MCALSDDGERPSFCSSIPNASHALNVPVGAAVENTESLPVRSAGRPSGVHFIARAKASIEVARLKKQEPALHAGYLACVEAAHKESKGRLAALYPSEYNSLRGAKERARKQGLQFDKVLYDFRDWLIHIGPRPAARWSVDRKDFHKGYVVGNIRWASKLTQTQNRHVTKWHSLPNGERVTTAKLAKFVGLQYSTVYKRLRAGWSVERMIAEMPQGMRKWMWPDEFVPLKPMYDARPRRKFYQAPLDWLIGRITTEAQKFQGSEEQARLLLERLSELEQQRDELLQQERQRKEVESAMVLAAVFGTFKFAAQSACEAKPNELWEKYKDRL